VPLAVGDGAAMKIDPSHPRSSRIVRMISAKVMSPRGWGVGSQVLDRKFMLRIGVYGGEAFECVNEPVTSLLLHRTYGKSARSHGFHSIGMCQGSLGTSNSH
jgi:hypothetical protein